MCTVNVFTFLIFLQKLKKLAKKLSAANEAINEDRCVQWVWSVGVSYSIVV